MEIQINGQKIQVHSDGDTPLLWVIRDELNYTGTKYGCGKALCGACTVHGATNGTRRARRSSNSAGGDKCSL